MKLKSQKNITKLKKHQQISTQKVKLKNVNLGSNIYNYQIF